MVWRSVGGEFGGKLEGPQGERLEIQDKEYYEEGGRRGTNYDDYLPVRPVDTACCYSTGTFVDHLLQCQFSPFSGINTQ